MWCAAGCSMGGNSDSGYGVVAAERSRRHQRRCSRVALLELRSKGPGWERGEVGCEDVGQVVQGRLHGGRRLDLW